MRRQEEEGIQETALYIECVGATKMALTVEELKESAMVQWCRHCIPLFAQEALMFLLSSVRVLTLKIRELTPNGCCWVRKQFRMSPYASIDFPPSRNQQLPSI